MKINFDGQLLILGTIGLVALFFVINGAKRAYMAYSYQGHLPIAGRAPATVTSAQASLANETVDVGNAGGVVILIPNEGHHGPEGSSQYNQTQFPKHGVFAPRNTIIPAGAEVVFLSDDPGHSHVINAGAAGRTSSLGENAVSAPIRFNTPGNYPIESIKYASLGQKGTIRVTANRAVPGRVVGAFWVPQSDAQRFIAAMSTAGCQVLSQANASKDADNQSVHDHTLLIYQANGTASAVAQKLTTLTKMTPYT